MNELWTQLLLLANLLSVLMHSGLCDIFSGLMNEPSVVLGGLWVSGPQGLQAVHTFSHSGSI